METFREKLLALPFARFSCDGIQIRPICDDYDLWYAVMECKLAPGQEDYVNPAGFTIGRAYLRPEDHLPCIIWKGDARIGYMILRKWYDGSANSWSFYLDQSQQGHGYGTIAARLAVQILKAADPSTPIKLAAEQANKKAHRLYQAIGFVHHGEMDGDDLVFDFEGDNL